MTHQPEVTTPAGSNSLGLVGKSIAILVITALCAFAGGSLVDSTSRSARQPIVGQATGMQSTGPAAPSEPGYLPAEYANQGKDGDGNVQTYEHD